MWSGNALAARPWGFCGPWADGMPAPLHYEFGRLVRSIAQKSVGCDLAVWQALEGPGRG